MGAILFCPPVPSRNHSTGTAPGVRLKVGEGKKSSSSSFSSSSSVLFINFEDDDEDEKEEESSFKLSLTRL